MVAVEVVAGVLILVLALVTTAAVYVGLLGVLGATRFAHCERCGHLSITSAKAAPTSCAYCRHDRLFHPLYAVHHAHLVHPFRR